MNAHEQRETFDALIRQHSPTYPAKIKELLELKDSIAQARKQGASYEIIRSYLHKTAISVSPDTVAQFCHQVLSEPKRRGSKRRHTLRAERNGASTRHPPKRAAPAQLSARYQPPGRPELLTPKIFNYEKRIDLILNAKGGVGKSFFAVNMGQYLKDKSLMKEILSDLDEAMNEFTAAEKEIQR